ncbi:MAG: sulfite exporter TauE/SafE family protein [Xanthobacteraceae bacterium]|nr:sulfite exporter TauE/SafE family protein [Xanthobacteraceae bacterium]
MTTEFLLLVAIGFVAQLIDGALGMAYGVITNSALLTIGLAPAPASALVHTAEVFTTGASAASHIYHRNVDWRFVMRLGIPGVLGAILGAWVLSNLDLAAARRWVYLYLLMMGCYILWKSFRIAAPRREPAKWLPPVGFAGGFLDASGGGGWGGIVTTTLIGSGHAPRQTVGSVNTTEFFVTVAAATTFFVELGTSPLQHLVPLVLGGVLAAPLGGWAVKKVSPRALMTAVGCLIVALSLFQLARIFKLI